MVITRQVRVWEARSTVRKTRAAARLGLKHTALLYRMEQLGIPR
jgi:transcriptional regulator with GAF, ATPase, and Fis domain